MNTVGRAARTSWSAAFIATLAFLAPRVQAQDARTERRPNIVLVIADDLGLGDVAPLGDGRIHTPTFARLAREGTVFRRAYAAAPVCAPSRCAILTGLHAGHCAVRRNRQPNVALSLSDPTLADALGAVGYRTAIVGKWGLGGESRPGIPFSMWSAPWHMGFGASVVLLDDNAAVSAFPLALWRDGVFTEIEENAGGARTRWVADVFDGEALAVLDGLLDGAAPFLLVVASTLPHRELFAPDTSEYADQDWPEIERTYAAMVTRFDADLGRIVARLEERGALEHTLVVVMSDHGPHDSDGHLVSFFGSGAGLRGQKRDLYEGGVRVPLLALGGGVPAGLTHDAPVSLVDLLPTLCALAGAPTPDGLDGTSFEAALTADAEATAEPAEPRAFFLGAAEAAGGAEPPTRYALIEWPLVLVEREDGVSELYDLDVDSGQARDLASERPADVERLRARRIAESTGSLVRADPVLGLAGEHVDLAAATPRDSVVVLDLDLRRVNERDGAARIESSATPHLYASIVGPSHDEDGARFDAARGDHLVVASHPGISFGGESFGLEARLALRARAASLEPSERQWLAVVKPTGTPDGAIDWGVLVQAADVGAAGDAGAGASPSALAVVFGLGRLREDDTWAARSRLTLDDTAEHTIAVRFDAERRTVRFEVDGEMDEVVFPEDLGHVRSDGPLVIGAHHDASGAFDAGFDGRLVSLRLIRGSAVPGPATPQREVVIDVGTLVLGGPEIARAASVVSDAASPSRAMTLTLESDGAHTDERVSASLSRTTVLGSSDTGATLSMVVTPSAVGDIDAAWVLGGTALRFGHDAVGSPILVRVRGRVSAPAASPAFSIPIGWFEAGGAVVLLVAFVFLARRRPSVRSGGSLLFAAVAVACTPDTPPADAATPADAGSCEPLEALERGASVGHAAPLAAGPVEARAGVLTAADLPVDRTGLALYGADDFVLANDRIAVIIEDANPSDLFDPWGGKPIGAGRVEGGRIVDAADFEEMIPALGLYTLHTEHVGVLSDGSDGGAAVVRAVGVIEAIPFLAAFVPGGLVAGSVDGVPAALDFSLAPSADHIEVRWVLDNTSTRLLAIATPVHAFLQASRMPPWSPDVGFDTSGADVYPYVAFVDDAATSFAYVASDGDLSIVLEAGGANFYATPRFTLPACARTEHLAGRLFVGDRVGLGGALRVVARAEGRTLSDLAVTVRDADGAFAAGIEVNATNAAGGHRERATSDAAGRVVLAVPPGEEIHLVPVLGGVVVGANATVAAGSTSADVVLHPLITVNVRALSALDRSPIPARLQIIATTPPERPPASFGARVERAERVAIAFEIDGEATFRVPVGNYRVVGSRGYEWEIDEARLDLVAGPAVDVELLLSHVVDTTGVLCGDFHIHTNRSPDAPDGAAFKIASAVADGLEVPARSDHEFVADFEDTIAALGATDYAYGVASLELTTYAWGHFGVLPLDPDPTQPNGGAIDWAYRSPPDVLSDARARTGRYGPAAVIVNHPRDTGAGAVAFAYFEAAGYDPVTGTASNAAVWDPGFSLIEVFNDSNFDRNLDGPVRDWFSFLTRGTRMFAVGSSDSHEVIGSPLGYPRTCLALGTDSTATLRTMGAGAVRDALLAGHATISGGIYVDARVGAAAPGDEATGLGARAMVAVTVQAASWVDPDRLRVYVDGAMVEEIPFTSTDAVLRFDDIVEVDVAAEGSWVVLVADGDAELEPVHPRRMPFGVTNPIFLRR